MKNILLWTIAFLITASSAVYQRLTGPTVPVKGEVSVGGQRVSYKLLRSHSSSSNYTIFIEVPDNSVSGQLFYKRYPTDDPWTTMSMARQDGKISADLPKQPASGKLEYYLIINKENDEVRIPSESSIVMRFKDDVPPVILISHAVIMFIAMFFSTRAGIEALKKEGSLKLYTYWTVGLLALGGMILGPIVQKYAFGAFWTGFPFGYDLTDNKTLIIFIGWIAALIAVIRRKNTRSWVLGASVLLLIVYMIPHSLLGSELDYEKVSYISKP